VFLEDIFNLDDPVEELGKEAVPGVNLFEKPLNFMKAFLSVFGKARGDRGPACLKLRSIVRQAMGDDGAGRRNFSLVTVARSHFFGEVMYNRLLKEVFTMDELYADLDSISGGEFSRRTKESIMLAVAEERARAAVELKEVEARAAAELKGLKDEAARLEGLKDEIVRLRRALEDSVAGKGPGGR
jgi:hypothetical protein